MDAFVQGGCRGKGRSGKVDNKRGGDLTTAAVERVDAVADACKFWHQSSRGGIRTGE